MSTHYTFLGIDRNASITDIKKAYRKLALQHHPDKSKSAESENIFKRLVEVYDILSNPEKKAAYDRTLVSVTKTFVPRAGPGGAYGYPFSSRPSNFRPSYQWHPQPPQPPQPPRPPHAQRTNGYKAKTTSSFSYDDDEFDFAYKNNRTARDSFADAKSYFQSTNRPQTFQNTPNNVKFGSNFQKTGSTSSAPPPPQAAPPKSGNQYGAYNAYMRASTDQRFNKTTPPHANSPNNDEPPYPRGPVPPHANNSSTSNAENHNFTHGSTSMPSVPTDPLPKSWKKQQTNFKNASTSTPSSSNNSQPSPPPSNNIPVPPHANSTLPKRPKTPPANNRPPFPTASSTSATGLKFDVSGLKDGSKSTPQNIRTQKKRVNKNFRNGIPLYSSSSSVPRPTFVSPSGRPVRTEQEPDAKFSDEEELVEIDEETFQKKEFLRNNKRAKSVPSDSSQSETPLDFKSFSKTTPLTQTNGEFNMDEMTSVLKESSDDIMNGKKTKKHKAGDYEVLNADKLSIIDGLSDISIPKTPSIQPQNFSEYKSYKNEFERFQLQAFDLRKKLTDFLGRRVLSDKACFLNVFRSDDNMTLYEQALTADVHAQVKLFETNQAIIRVMNDYKKYKNTFE